VNGLGHIEDRGYSLIPNRKSSFHFFIPGILLKIIKRIGCANSLSGGLGGHNRLNCMGI
jgi:hypothetical protein